VQIALAEAVWEEDAEVGAEEAVTFALPADPVAEVWGDVASVVGNAEGLARSAGFGTFTAARMCFPQVVRRVLTRWRSVLRATVHILRLCKPSLLVGNAQREFKDDADSVDATTSVCRSVASLLRTLGLGELLEGAPRCQAREALRRGASRWVAHVVQVGGAAASAPAVNALLRRLVGLDRGGCRYPLAERPRLLALPTSYTQLHTVMTTLTGSTTSSNPALCCLCGAVMEAGGGSVSRHVRRCCQDGGVVFLLQDSTILLSVGGFCSYFPSPYVDDHGERHRQFRGKPLHLDERRYGELRRLWASHGVGNEVVGKRSTAPRVIITGYY
jgi:hypothetical protein